MQFNRVSASISSVVLASFVVCAGLCEVSCAPPAIVLSAVGMPCVTDADCGLMQCDNKVCTRTCKAQGDCPAGFDCGIQVPADATSTGRGATCYKATYTAPAMGGYGADCAAFSPDATGKACDIAVTNPCAAGFTCLASRRCDPAAYCTKEGCATDADCPPTMFCAQPTDANRACAADGECASGMNCAIPPGGTNTTKLCLHARRCEKRTACATCGNDDQCPTGTICAVDKTGERFCGTLCKDVVNCPQPENDAMVSPLSNNFQECVDAGNGSGKTVCRPAQGACHGPSNVLAGQIGAICSPCRIDVPSDCPGGFCYHDVGGFNPETFCTIPCTIKIKSVAQDGTVSSSDDTCPTGTHCQAVVTVKPPSTANGICDGDGNMGADGFHSYYATTCFPLTM